jgi:phage terminase large subunit GpA-like protein
VNAELLVLSDSGLLASGYETFWNAAIDGLNPEPTLSTTEWSVSHAVVPKATGAAEPGPWRMSRTPLAECLLDALSDGSPYTKIVARIPSQMFKTQVFLNWICEIVDQRPANVLVFEPDGNVAKRVSARVDHAFKETRRLEGKVHTSRARDEKNTIQTKGFTGGAVHIQTVNSPSAMAEIAAQFVILDEISRYPGDVGGEGRPDKVVAGRMTTFGDRAKMFVCSTPVAQGEDVIDELYDEGTQSVVEISCPHCKEWFVPAWEMMKWEADYSQVWLVCPVSGCLIVEEDKANFLKKGGFRILNRFEGETNTFSFWFEAILGPYGWAGWKMLAQAYDKAAKALKAGDSSGMQAFHNIRLARSYKVTGELLDWEILFERSRLEKRPIRVVPIGGLVCGMTVDVQIDRLEYQIVAVGRNEESWLVDYGVIDGDPVQGEVWEELTKLRRRPLQHACGTMVRIEGCVVDSSYLSHFVYQYARQHDRERVFAIKGNGEPYKPVLGGKNQLDVKVNGIADSGPKCWVWSIGTTVAKDIVAGRLALTQPGPGCIHLADWVDQAYCKQLSSEERKIVKYKGKEVSRWERVAGKPPNEKWDLWQYHVFFTQALGLHKWRAHDWDRVEAVVQPATHDLFAEKAASDGTESVKPTVHVPLGGMINLGGWKRGS